jgi:hypothetical protein
MRIAARASLACLGALIAGLGFAVVPAAADVVGKAAAVNTVAKGSGKVLVLGSQVLHNERIETDASGSVQLLFVDRTTIDIGPNSSVVIDDYVFNPSRGSGSMTLTVSKGLLRFVGGRVTHEGAATIKTPTATMGIRGGTAQFSVGPGGTQATYLGSNRPNGGLFIKGAAGDVVNLIRPGFSTIVGNAPTAPHRIDPQLLATQNNDLGSRLGEHGGAGNGIAGQLADFSKGDKGAVTGNNVNNRSTTVNGEGRGNNENGYGFDTSDLHDALQGHQLVDPIFDGPPPPLCEYNCPGDVD